MDKKTRKQVIKKFRATGPDQIIAVIFSFLPDRFSADTEILHTKIRKLRAKEEHQNLLKAFMFVDKYPFAHSPLLENVLNRLQQAQILAAISPDFTCYRLINPEIIKKEILPRFSHDKQKSLSGLQRS